MTDASIIIPTRGGAARLPVLLEALRAQETESWEAVVVIDGDIDNSTQVLERYRDLPVRSSVFPENRGRVAALNEGFSVAGGHVLIRCDDDLQPRPDYVRRHIAHHQGAPKGVIGLYLNNFPEGRYAEIYGRAADAQYRRGAYCRPPHERWHYWAGNCSISRETWLAIGPYDSRYRAYGWEDVDYGYRLHRAGIPVEIDPKLETAHNVAATSTASRTRRAFRSGQARHLFDTIHGVGVSGSRVADRADAWNTLVSQLSRHLDYQSSVRVAHGVDSMIPYLPRPLARKAVSLIVEASANAGLNKPEGVSNDI
ncbi:hypothetical protein GCM10027599_10960 [Yimella radicis]